jgi:hypothetical protein
LDPQASMVVRNFRRNSAMALSSFAKQAGCGLA